MKFLQDENFRLIERKGIVKVIKTIRNGCIIYREIYQLNSFELSGINDPRLVFNLIKSMYEKT